MADKLIRFKVVDYGSKNNPYTEFQHCYIYEEPITVIDARYVVSTATRGVYWQGLTVWGVKMLFLNPSLTMDGLKEEMYKLIKSANIGIKYPTVNEGDINRICVDIYGLDGGVEQYKSIFSGNEISCLNFFCERKSLTKQSISAITSLDESEMDRYDEILNDKGLEEAELYKRKVARVKTNRYIASCRRQTKDGIIDSEVAALRADGYSSYEIREFMSESITNRKRLNDVLKRNGVYVEGGSNAKLQMDATGKIIAAGDDIHYNDRQIINKYRIEIKSKQLNAPVSRPTIYKHWDELEERFNDLNNKLKQTA